MKKKLLIAAALLLVAAVGAYFCWPVRLLPAGEDLGELEIAYLEHSAEGGELSSLSERYRLTPDMPEYAEALELLQMSRCQAKPLLYAIRGLLASVPQLTV